jgi:hypothetical protein
MPELKHRNVARLFDAYTDNLEEGYFGHYIADVMAIFTEIGEPGKSTFGAALGAARIIWGNASGIELNPSAPHRWCRHVQARTNDLSRKRQKCVSSISAHT